MRRYWLSFLLLLAPCLSLGLWAIWQSHGNAAANQANLRRSLEELSRETAAAELAALVRGVGATCGTISADRASALADLMDWGCLALAFVLNDTAPMTAIQKYHPAPAAQIPDDPRLAQARRAEFVDADPTAALAAYRGLMEDVATGAALHQEAVIGFSSCSLQTGDKAVAVKALQELITQTDVRGPALLQVAILLQRAWSEQSLQSQLAPLILQVWTKLLSVDDASAAALADNLRTDLSGRLRGEDELRFARVLKALDYDKRVRTFMSSWSGKDLADLRNRSAKDAAYAVAEGGVTVMLPTQAAGERLVMSFAPKRLSEQITAHLSGAPVLMQLAKTYVDQYGDLPTAPDLGVTTPWGGELRVAMPVFPQGSGGGLLSSANLNVLFLAGALLSIVVGFAALYLATAKDLRVVRLKSDFVSGVTHELKTPLSLIRMYAELIAGGYAKDDQERGAYHGVIEAECQRLTLLIDNILDFTAIEQGRKKYDRQPVDLSALVESALTTFKPQLDRDGFTVDTSLEAIPMLNADKNAITQVVVNLLANAMKYSGQDKRLALRVEQAGDKAVISVSDRGIGIPKEEQQRIFEPFYRVETGLTRATRGAGLGLSLVKSIVQDHGGTVELESAPGQGSTFRVSLPAERA
jgi:signal transduction histidine kinase